jgi:uncharacterized membrane protein YdjX (TVP38/TMEM64 family)
MGWLFWAVLLRLSGMQHPSVPVWPEISTGRRWLAVCALLMLVLTFFYIPLPGSVFDFAGALFGPLHHWRLTR